MRKDIGEIAAVKDQNGDILVMEEDKAKMAGLFFKPVKHGK